jgi:hypothetical protein
MNKTWGRGKMFITRESAVSWLSSSSTPSQPLLKPLIPFFGGKFLYNYGLWLTSWLSPKRHQKNILKDKRMKMKQ